MDQFFPTVTLESGIFVDLDVFISFLKSNKAPSDVKKEVRIYNVIRLYSRDTKVE